MNICHKCQVTGRVQDVFFRAATQKRAHELGVSGWARNLPDGSVEVFACGKEEAVHALMEWLWQGSPSARVEQVECEELPFQQMTGFHTR